jgi:hypothetical protein
MPKTNKYKRFARVIPPDQRRRIGRTARLKSWLLITTHGIINKVVLC